MTSADFGAPSPVGPALSTSSRGGAAGTGDSEPTWTRYIRGAVSSDRLVWVALALIWVLGHSFVGIDHDARVYMGRALADLDPAGVGHDMMFELDGQTAFTIFRFVARALVAALGLGRTVGVLTIVNLAVWFAAIVCLVRALVPGRAALFVLLIALVLPRFYGPWHVFAAGESVPVPRPLAEACVLLALAAVLHSRMRLAVVALIAATLFHPIMAAPGFAVLFLLLVREDRRWLFAAAVVIALVAAAVAIDASLGSRLGAVLDPDWRAILTDRTPYLFPGLWPADTYAMHVVQATTVVIAAFLVERRVRHLLLFIIAVGVSAGLVSLALTSGLSNLLVVQAQLWRATWLLAALAPVAAGICAWRLPPGGRAGQIAVALLALAWVTMEWMPLGPIAAMAALLCFWLDRRGLAFSRTAVVAIVGACIAGIIIVEAIPLSALVTIFAARPTGASLPWTVVWGTAVMAVPVALLATAWWRFHDRTGMRIGVPVTVVGLAILALAVWDSRSTFKASIDSGQPRTDLKAMLASRPGDVLWLERDEIWGWLGRANWTGSAHGSPIVFSRPLALKWHDRTRAAVRHGLAPPAILAPWKPGLSKTTPDVGHADVTGFCRRRDAPAWIVVPLEAGRPAPGLPGLAVWTPSGTDWALATGSNGFRWVATDRFGIIPCGQDGHAP